MKEMKVVNGRNMLVDVITSRETVGLALAFPKNYNEKVIFGEEARQIAFVAEVGGNVREVGFIHKARFKQGYYVYPSDNDDFGFGLGNGVLEERQLDSIRNSHRFSLEEWISMGRPLFLDFQLVEKRYYAPLEEEK